jgi:hypothetical protein
MGPETKNNCAGEAESNLLLCSERACSEPHSDINKHRPLSLLLCKHSLYLLQGFTFTHSSSLWNKKKPETLNPGLQRKGSAVFSRRMHKPSADFTQFLFSEHSACSFRYFFCPITTSPYKFICDCMNRYFLYLEL